MPHAFPHEPVPGRHHVSSHIPALHFVIVVTRQCSSLGLQEGPGENAGDLGELQRGVGPLRRDCHCVSLGFSGSGVPYGASAAFPYPCTPHTNIALSAMAEWGHDDADRVRRGGPAEEMETP
jgi:hypothetical protein